MSALLCAMHTILKDLISDHCPSLGSGSFCMRGGAVLLAKSFRSLQAGYPLLGVYSYEYLGLRTISSLRTFALYLLTRFVTNGT